jgi:hypothetical protein
VVSAEDGKAGRMSGSRIHPNWANTPSLDDDEQRAAYVEAMLLRIGLLGITMPEPHGAHRRVNMGGEAHAGTLAHRGALEGSEVGAKHNEHATSLQHG